VGCELGPVAQIKIPPLWAGNRIARAGFAYGSRELDNSYPIAAALAPAAIDSGDFQKEQHADHFLNRRRNAPPFSHRIMQRPLRRHRPKSFDRASPSQTNDLAPLWKFCLKERVKLLGSPSNGFGAKLVHLVFQTLGSV
jgi:hypothetical protein